MDIRFETLTTATEIDAAYATAPEPAPIESIEQTPQLHTSLLELNSLFLVLIAALAAIFTAAAFLISTR